MVPESVIARTLCNPLLNCNLLRSRTVGDSDVTSAGGEIVYADGGIGAVPGDSEGFGVVVHTVLDKRVRKDCASSVRFNPPESNYGGGLQTLNQATLSSTTISYPQLDWRVLVARQSTVIDFRRLRLLGKHNSSSRNEEERLKGLPVQHLDIRRSRSMENKNCIVRWIYVNLNLYSSSTTIGWCVLPED